MRVRVCPNGHGMVEELALPKTKVPLRQFRESDSHWLITGFYAEVNQAVRVTCSVCGHELREEEITVRR